MNGHLEFLKSFRMSSGFESSKIKQNEVADVMNIDKTFKKKRFRRTKKNNLTMKILMKLMMIDQKILSNIAQYTRFHRKISIFTTSFTHSCLCIFAGIIVHRMQSYFTAIVFHNN